MAASRRGPLLTLFLTVFIDLLGFGLFLPTLQYMADRFHASETQMGLLMAVFSLAQFVFAPLWGALSDRIGRRPVLLISISGGGIAYLLFGLSGSLTMLFVARTLAGMFAANISTAQAYVADVTTPEDRARGMGLIGAAFGLGFTLGPPIGGFLAGDVHFERPALFAAAMCAMNVILAAMTLPESHVERSADRARRSRFQEIRAALTTPRIAPLVVLFFVVTFAFSQMEAALPLATMRQFHWLPRQNGELLGLAGILMALMQGGLIGRLSRRFGERKLVVSGSALIALALFILARSDHASGYWAAMVPLALGQGLCSPSMSSLLSRAAPAAERGSTMGVAASAGSLARITAPGWAGWSFQHITYGAPFATGALVALVAFALGISLPAEASETIALNGQDISPAAGRH